MKLNMTKEEMKHLEMSYIYDGKHSQVKRITIEEMIQKRALIKIESTECYCEGQCVCDKEANRLFDEVEQVNNIRMSTQKELLVPTMPMTGEDMKDQYPKDIDRESVVIIWGREKYSPVFSDQENIIMNLIPLAYHKVLRTHLAGVLERNLRPYGYANPQEPHSIILDLDNRRIWLLIHNILLPKPSTSNQKPDIFKSIHVISVSLDPNQEKVWVYPALEPFALDTASIPKHIAEICGIRDTSIESFVAEPQNGPWYEPWYELVTSFLKRRPQSTRVIEKHSHEVIREQSEELESDDDSDNSRESLPDILKQKQEEGKISSDEAQVIQAATDRWIKEMRNSELVKSMTVGPPANFSCSDSVRKHESESD